MKVTASVLTVAAMLFGCSGEPANILADIQSDLDHSLALHEKGYTVTALSIDHGFLTLRVSGLHQQAHDDLARGEKLAWIEFAHDESVSALIETEEMLKKRSQVKGVSWTPDP